MYAHRVVVCVVGGRACDTNIFLSNFPDFPQFRNSQEPLMIYDTNIYLFPGIPEFPGATYDIRYQHLFPKFTGIPEYPGAPYDLRYQHLFPKFPTFPGIPEFTGAPYDIRYQHLFPKFPGTPEFPGPSDITSLPGIPGIPQG